MSDGLALSRDRRTWVQGFLSLLPILAVFAAIGFGFFFLTQSPLSDDIFLAGANDFGFAGHAPALVAVAILVLSLMMKHAGLRGELRLASEGGMAWRRSVQSRLEEVGQNCLALLLAPNLLSAFLTLWKAGDLARVGVSGLFLFGVALAVGIGLVQLVSLKRLLVIDPAGIRAKGLPGGHLDWNEVDAVFLHDDDPGGVVTLRVEGHGAGDKRFKLDLEAVGLTGRAFIKRLAEIAPQVDLRTPMSGRL